jgi:Mg/Co/Ni transporter MgtE
MTALEAVLEQIAKLSPEDRAKVREQMDTETRTMTIYTVSSEDMRKAFEAFDPVQQDTENMSEEELDDFLSEVIAEVREERRAKSRN